MATILFYSPTKDHGHEPGPGNGSNVSSSANGSALYQHALLDRRQDGGTLMTDFHLIKRYNSDNHLHKQKPVYKTTRHRSTGTLEIYKITVTGEPNTFSGRDNGFIGHNPEAILNEDPHPHTNGHKHAINGLAGHTNVADVSSKPGKRHISPLLFCSFICSHPKLSFSLTLGLHLAMIVITAILYLAGYNIAPTNFNKIPIFLRNEDVHLRAMAWVNRDKDHIIYDRTTAGRNITERSLSYDDVAVTLIYDAGDDGNVFTKQHLTNIKEFEDEIYTDERYQKYCVLNSGACAKLFSILRYFDGTYSEVNPIFNDTGFNNIVNVLTAANTEISVRRQLQFFLGTDSIIDASRNISTSHVTRTMIHFGYPIIGYNTSRDQNREQAKVIENFIVKTYGKHWENIAKNGLNGLRFLYGNRAMQWNIINSQVVTDMLFIGGSFMFIFSFMWAQTSSLWLTTWGMISVVLCLPTGNLIYNLVFDFKYIGIFHILALFILLGIGADDVFIFCDTWKAHKQNSYPSLAHRLSEVYRQAAGTMLVTSFTTAAAFFTSSFSPILAISSFGTFAGIIVLVNYFSIIIFYPTALIVWHLNWEQKPCCVSTYHNNNPNCPDENTVDITTSDSTISNRVAIESRHSSRIIVRFLSGPYFRFLCNNVVRTILVIIFVVILGTFVYFLTRLEADDEQPKIMKDEHMVQRFFAFMARRFRAGGYSVAKQYIVWGMKNQDMSACHQRSFDEDCTGKTVWDNAFDLNPPPAQKALINFCHKLLAMSKSDTDMYNIKRNIITDLPEVNCFILPMKDALQRETDRIYSNGSHVYTEELNLTLPLTAQTMRDFMETRADVYPYVHDTFYRYFETALFYWLTDGHNVRIGSDDRVIYQPLLGESLDKIDSQNINSQRSGEKFGTRLRYAAISVNLTINLLAAKYTDGLEAYRHWEKFIQKEMSELPPTLQNGFHTTTRAWHWFHVEEILVKQGVITVGAGISVAWLVLVLSSGNIIVGTMATFTIASITACVVGLIPILGWKLGVLEALNMTLVVGLSVDYVVHLGVAYTYAPVTDRKGRVHHALREIGLSIMSGAITTLGSGFFMLFAQVVFFMQFGIFIFATIGFSILFSMTFFLVFLSLVGPQGTTGMTAPFVKKFRSALTWKAGTRERCSQCNGSGYITRGDGTSRPIDTVDSNNKNNSHVTSIS